MRGLLILDVGETMNFLNAHIVESVVTELVPVLFENYVDGDSDFAYLGGDEGRGKLESALAQPRQTFYGEFLYPEMEDKVTALLWSIIKNHPFVDGNKRAALTTANLFLLVNRQVLLATQSDALEVCLRIAGGNPPIDRERVSTWVGSRLVDLNDEGAIERIYSFLDAHVSTHLGDFVAQQNFLQAAFSLPEDAWEVLAAD